MRTPHTSTYSGKRVYVRLRNGRRFIDKFIDKKGHFVVFQTAGKIPAGDIAAFAIYRHVNART